MMCVLYTSKYGAVSKYVSFYQAYTPKLFIVLYSEVILAMCKFVAISYSVVYKNACSNHADFINHAHFIAKVVHKDRVQGSRACPSRGRKVIALLLHSLNPMQESEYFTLLSELFSQTVLYLVANTMYSKQLSLMAPEALFNGHLQISNGSPSGSFTHPVISLLILNSEKNFTSKYLFLCEGNKK